MLLNKIIYFLGLYSICDSFKILLVFPIYGRSHATLGEGYVRHLLNDGHEVTYVTSLPMKISHPRLRQIDVSTNESRTFTEFWFDLVRIKRKKYDMSNIVFLPSRYLELTQYTLLNPNIQSLIEDPKEYFDAVVAEWLNSELYSGFAAVFNCPLIWSSSMEPHLMILALIDEFPNVGYTFYRHDYVPPFTFWQRTKQLITAIGIAISKWLIRDQENQLFNTAFYHAVAKRGRAFLSLHEVKNNGSLVLGNSHFTSGPVIPLPRNYINIGGYYRNDKPEPLPQDLQVIMNNATDGVIFFSMGSLLKSCTISDGIKRGLLEMFSKFKQIVIWKFEEKLSNVPKNVHIVSWAPQQSILEHPNCVLFITHGGIMSVMEALRSGVPIIGVPIFGDQFINVQRAVARGVAMRVDLNEETVQNMEGAIKEMFETSSYRQKAKELSLIYRDRMTSPGKDLVHWIRHVVNTKGALHLRSPATLFSWYQKMYLDLVVGISLLIYMSAKLLKYIFCIKTNSNVFERKNCNV